MMDIERRKRKILKEKYLMEKERENKESKELHFEPFSETV